MALQPGESDTRTGNQAERNSGPAALAQAIAAGASDLAESCAICGHSPPLVALRQRPNAYLRGVPGGDPNAPTWETVCGWQSGCMAPDSVRRVTGIGWRVPCAYPDKCPQHAARKEA